MNNQDTTMTSQCCGGACEAPEAARTARPIYQVAETETGVTLDVALPGVRKEDVSVSAAENILTLTAPRADAVPDAWRPLRSAARPDGYELRIRLNRSLDPARIEARLENGILRLAIAKREEAVPRSISVN